jgi:DNA-binding NarL/FixJ family response regulator
MPRHAPITVVLARFDDLIAKGLRASLESDPSLTVIAADVDPTRLDVVLRANAPDVAIIDAEELAKLSKVRDLVDSHPATRVVLIAKDPSLAECAQLLAFGASACLGRDTQSRDVLSAIHLASRGLQVTPGSTAEPAGAAVAGRELLTRREAEILPLLQDDRSNAQIAVALQVGVETVRTHARNIYRKLGVTSRRELAARPSPREAPERVLPAQPIGRRPYASARPRRGRSLRGH